MEESFVAGFEAGLEKIAKKRKAKGSKDDEKKDRAGSYGKAAKRVGGLGAILGGASGALMGGGARKTPTTIKVTKIKPKKGKKGPVKMKMALRRGKKFSKKRRVLHAAGGGAAGALVGGGLGALEGLIHRWKSGAD